jgi:hypothetical protein
MGINVQPATPVKTAAANLESAVVADIHTRLAALETTAKSDAAKVKAWVATNWPHAVTWIGGAWIAVKAGLLHLL